MTAWREDAVFTHLIAMSDDCGVFEHARHDRPRRDEGYCVDDVARALVVLAREPRLGPDEERLASICVAFVDAAVGPDGRVRNRKSADGEFTSQPGTGDWWGRAMWSLGVAAARWPRQERGDRALAAFRRAASTRSPYVRATAFASLGAREVLGIHPEDAGARRLLRDLIDMIPLQREGTWPWPEERLHYANAALPEALLAAGDGLDDAATVTRGIELLRFLLALETAEGHLSVTGVGGRGPGERGPFFDQQPIEVATIADACARAYALTGDRRWRDGVGMAWGWFLGDNDTGVPMLDPQTGAGYDGLTREGRNENRGAESTLAMLSTFQQARRVGAVREVVS